MEKKLLLLFVILFLSCEKSADLLVPEISFYHWKNELNLSNYQANYLNTLKSKKLYLRFFDVDWDEDRREPTPLSIINITSTNHLPEKIIPTIFITNRTFLKIKKNKISIFTENLFFKIKEIRKALPNTQIPEIQIDCDWTKKTKENYFHFLKILKSTLTKENINLSVTIRLHQLKYPKQTGIPPADRGALMCYNVGDLQKWETENSILDDEMTATYLKNNMDYALPLDLALPVFQWGILFRDGEMIKLINQLTPNELSNQNFYTPKTKTRYTVKKSTYLHGHYLYPNDQIRLESVPTKTLKTVARQLKASLPAHERTLLFYHLDTLTISKYPVTKIKEIQRIFEE